MPTIERLREIRRIEGESLKKLNVKLSEKKEKKKLKEEIRTLKAAKLRSKFGVSKEGVHKIGSAFKKSFEGSGKQLWGIGKSVGKGLMGAGMAANQMQGMAPNQMYGMEPRRARPTRKAMRKAVRKTVKKEVKKALKKAKKRKKAVKKVVRQEQNYHMGLYGGPGMY